MSTGDSNRGRAAFSALDLAVAAELFMTPTAELCDYVLPATSFLEMANLTAASRIDFKASLICNTALPLFRLWRSAAPIPGLSLSWPSASDSAKSSGMEMSKRAMPMNRLQPA